MAGPDYTATGGGANYLCLPDDPQYNLKKQTAIGVHTSMRAVWYQSTYSESNNIQGSVYANRAPCAVCEAEQRVTQVMIPAKTNCPSDWVLEYEGFIMSQAEHHSTNSDSFLPDTDYFRGTYICVDENIEAHGSKITSHEGSPIYMVRAACSGRVALNSCPPYRSDRMAISCVVCSK